MSSLVLVNRQLVQHHRLEAKKMSVSKKKSGAWGQSCDGLLKINEFLAIFEHKENLLFFNHRVNAERLQKTKNVTILTDCCKHQGRN